jgi:S1-C subfamily serine protease
MKSSILRTLAAHGFLLLLLAGAGMSAAQTTQGTTQGAPAATEPATVPATVPATPAVTGTAIATDTERSTESATESNTVPDLAALLAQKEPALVTVKFVLQIKIGGAMASALGGDQEQETEVHCPVIGPKGLILCSSTLFNSYVDLIAQMIPQGIELSPIPKDIKVLTGKEGEELPASLIVRDSDRDLVWLRVDDPGERTFPYIDFSQGVELPVGAEIVALWRMDRFYERVPVLSRTTIGGVTKRPRPLLVPAAPLAAGLGAPVLDLKGRPVGFTISQVADDGSLQEDNPFSAVARTIRLQQGVQGLILPAAEIARATQQVLEMEQETAE